MQSSEHARGFEYIVANRKDKWNEKSLKIGERCFVLSFKVIVSADVVKILEDKCHVDLGMGLCGQRQGPK